MRHIHHPILRLLNEIPHWLHWVVLTLSFIGLFSIGFVRLGSGTVIITLTPRLDEFRLREQGLYALIIVTIICPFAYNWIHSLRHGNLIALEMRRVSENSLDWTSASFIDSDQELMLDPVTTANLDLFLKHIEDAYPTGVSSKMTSEEREDTYREWVESGNNSSVCLVRRRKRDSNVTGAVVGFSACVIVNRAYFSRLSSGIYDGFQVADKDLGDDPLVLDGNDARFVVMFHWYIRRGRASRVAMNWLLVATLRRIHPPGDVRRLVLYGHTVSKEGQANYTAVGGALIGNTPRCHYPQFVLDSRIFRRERRRNGNRTLARIALAKTETYRSKS